MSLTSFQEIGKARHAADLSHTGIKVLVRDGVSYLFPTAQAIGQLLGWDELDVKQWYNGNL